MGALRASNETGMMLWSSIAAVALCGFMASFQASQPPQPSPTSPPQTDAAGSPQAAPAESNAAANELVRNVVNNELKAMDEDHSHWMYRLETVEHGAKETKDVVETKDGDVTRLVARNGQPLTPDEQKAEDERMEKFIHDPAEQKKQQEDAADDSRKMKSLLAMLPNALAYSAPEASGSTTKLKFQPNPAFHPPSREAHVFHEMEGELVVDTKQKRIVEFSGHLIHTVDFGGGLLGHLNQGGTFDVRQEEVAPGIWEMALLKVNMTGKALFFKTVSVQQDEKHSDFHRVPDTLTLDQAEDMLRKQVASK